MKSREEMFAIYIIDNNSYERFNKLFEITDKNNGIWSAEAEKYLLENF